MALSSAALVGVTYGVIEAGQSGWASAAAWAPMVAGMLLVGVFAAWERRSPQPLIDLTLFASRDFTIGTLLATLATFALFGLIFVMPSTSRMSAEPTPSAPACGCCR